MLTRYLTLASLGVFITLTGGCGSTSTPTVTGKTITPTGTTNFSPKTGEFSVFFPVTPIEQQTEVPSEAGPLATRVYIANTTAITYVVVSTAIPDNAGVSNTKVFLDAAEKGMLKTSQGKLEKSEEINLAGMAGRELRTSMRNGAAFSNVRIYVTPKSSYSVMAVGMKEKLASNKAQIAKVLDSFRLKGG